MQRPSFSLTRSPFRLSALALAGSLLAASLQAQEQSHATAERVARPSSAQLLGQDVPLPLAAENIYLEGDTLSGVTGENVVLSGSAKLEYEGTTVQADALEYRQSDNRALARGSVRIEKDGNVFTGDEVNIDPDTLEGYMTTPSYHFAISQGGGQAERIQFIDKQHATLIGGNYSSCICTPEDPKGHACAGKNGKPAWELRADKVDFDLDDETGLARGVQLRFMDVPILAAPILSFPLTDKRKSGLLPPSIAIDSTSGVEYHQPVYWNIAPHMDATFTPSIKTKRGLSLGQEFRYLGERNALQWRGNIMPNDRLRHRDRWGISGDFQQALDLPAQLSPRDSLNLSARLNRVSDGNYWRDFSDVNALTERTLPSELRLDWESEGRYARIRSLKWQTQQIDESVVTPPYDRLPSLTLGWKGGGISGFRYHTEIEHSKFEADKSLTLQPNGRRTVAKAEVAYALRQPSWFVVPKAKWQWRHYALDEALPTGRKNHSLSVPTLSLDAGLIFEREATFFGKNYVQSLEPRAFYTYTPYREQNDLPNFDSAQNDFNFTSIYTENAFNGEDRVANNNLLTLGVQSRLVNPETGGELLRLAYAQRLRFKDQRVVLPGGEADEARLSDMLFGAQAQISERWSADGIVQYNPKSERSERATLGGRYHPSPYHVVSAAYRYQRGQSELLDIGWQWPLNRGSAPVSGAQYAGWGLGPGRWYSVGRINYSLPENKPVDSLIGLEYDGGCWIGRFALERRSNTASQSSKRILFQLEFVGFSRIGASPLQTLQENVPRYQLLRDPNITRNRPFLDLD